MTDQKPHQDKTFGEQDELAPKTSTVVKAREQAGRNAGYVWARDTLPMRRTSSLATPAVHPDAVELALRLTKRLGDTPSVVVFTGIERAAGVSTVAREVAHALAQSSWDPVLLVDANFRHPALAHHLGIGERPGLVDLIRGECSLETALVEIVPESLFLLPAGDGASDSCSLLSTAMCAEIWRSLRLQFGTVIVDSTPAGASVDGLVVCSQAQYVVLVVQQSRHRSTELQEMKSVLGALGVQELGICLSNKATNR